MIWRCGTFSFDSQVPVVMGILNVTPDSFSDGGSHTTLDQALAHAHDMLEQGALIIDVGGESTRPGSSPVDADEELARVLDVVRTLAAEGVCISIDTRHATVARACIEAGASIINDVTGFTDPAMRELAASCDAGLVVMHWERDGASLEGVLHAPATDPLSGASPAQAGIGAHREGAAGDLVSDVRAWLGAQAAGLQKLGIARERICLDPGPGFGKTPRQSLELMRNLHEVVRLGYPVMAAPSRKSYVGVAYGIDEPAERDQASATEALLACELGASVVRTHNVAATIEALADVRPYALVALGCNVPLVADPGQEREGKVAMLNQALADMVLMPDTQLIDVSSFYASEPAYKTDQDEFVNAVALVRTGLAPRDLLKYLQAIEDSLGRVRVEANGPRTCDLDILDYQLYVSNDEQLTLPHPLLHERDFVVKPLLEILPHHVLADGTPVSLDTVKIGSATRI